MTFFSTCEWKNKKATGVALRSEMAIILVLWLFVISFCLEANTFLPFLFLCTKYMCPTWNASYIFWDILDSSSMSPWATWVKVQTHGLLWALTAIQIWQNFLFVSTLYHKFSLGSLGHFRIHLLRTLAMSITSMSQTDHKSWGCEVVIFHVLAHVRPRGIRSPDTFFIISEIWCVLMRIHCFYQ